MSQVSNLIREIDRQVKNEGRLYGSVWAKLREKYASKAPRPIPAKRKTVRAFKEIVRLHGSALENLRKERYELDKGRCTKCDAPLPLDGPLTVRAHLAHVRNKRMWGDTLENTRIKCYHCHIELEHQKGIK